MPDDGRQRLLELFDVPRETLSRLDSFVEFLTLENESQNLISKGTVPEIWTRHILDSAQLLRFAGKPKSWLDLGTGAGFPGLVIAALSGAQVTMIEARPLRVDFLRRAAALLNLGPGTEIICSKVERAPRRSYDVISARAFAPLERLFELGLPFAHEETTWLLPKGRNAASELEGARSLWQGSFRVEPSLTDSDSGIVVARRVTRQAKGAKRR